jgi:hypothetical protein
MSDAGQYKRQAQGSSPEAEARGGRALKAPHDEFGDSFLPTARHYVNSNHVVRVTCGKCNGKMRLDLQTLSSGRYADTGLENLPIKCAASEGKFTVTIEYVDTRY